MSLRWKDAGLIKNPSMARFCHGLVGLDLFINCSGWKMHMPVGWWQRGCQLQTHVHVTANHIQAHVIYATAQFKFKLSGKLFHFSCDELNCKMRFTFPPCSESCRNWVQHHLESGNEVPADVEGEQTFMSWKASSKNMPNFIFNVPTCFTSKSCHLKTLGSEFLARRFVGR